MNITVSASILSANFAHLQSEVDSVEKAGVDKLHIDVMDGHFVPNLTFSDVIVKDLQTELPLDIHLMVYNPENYIEAFLRSLPNGRKPKNDLITVHAEACVHLHRIIGLVKESGFKVGVALNPASSLGMIEEVISEIDQVLIMTVNPGFSGQVFISSMLNKVRDLRANFPDLSIQVDGGVNSDTAKLCVGAGANHLVSASYLFGTKDRKQAVASLRLE